MIERRHQIWRRDLNDAVRDTDGKFSFEKLGTYAGQFIAARYLWEHIDGVIPGWDIMTVWFTVLIAPSLFKKLMSLKYGGPADQQVVTTTATAATVTTTEGKK